MGDFSDTKLIIVISAVSMALYLSGFFVLLTPLPFFYAITVRGKGVSIVSALIAIVAIYFLYHMSFNGKAAPSIGHAQLTLPSASNLKIGTHLSTFMGSIYFAYLAFLGFVVGDGVLRKWSTIRLSTYSIVIGSAAVFAVYIYGTVFSPELFSGMEERVSSIIKALLNMYVNSEGADTELSALADKSDSIAAFMIGISPALLVVYTLIAMVINFGIGMSTFAKRRYCRKSNFINFRMPDYMVWPIIFVGALYFINDSMFHSSSVKFIALNCVIVVLSLYFLQGLAVLSFIIRRVRGWFFRLALYSFLI